MRTEQEESLLNRRQVLQGAGVLAATAVGAMFVPKIFKKSLLQYVEPLDNTIPKLSVQDLIVPKGTNVQVPSVVVDRLGAPPVVEARDVPINIRSLLEKIVIDQVPYAPQIIDELILLPHPGGIDISHRDHIETTESIMVGITALHKENRAQNGDEFGVNRRLFMFVPEYVLAGGDLSKRLIHNNFIHYAKGRTPTTVGELLEWVFMHEIGHLVDYNFSKKTICENGKAADCVSLDNFLGSDGNPVLKGVINHNSVSALLGMQDYGDALLNTDELHHNIKMQTGGTKYSSIEGGGWRVGYNDGNYAFEYPCVRQGYLPQAIKNQSDIGADIKSGLYPSLYAYFEPDQERFGEFFAWWQFNRRREVNNGSMGLPSKLDQHFDSIQNEMLRKV